MQFNGSDCTVRILVGNREGLAARRGAAVKNAEPISTIGTYKRGDKLRTFVLNYDMAGAQRGALRNVSRLNSSRGCDQASRDECDPFFPKLCFRVSATETDHGRGNLLIVPANLNSSREPIFADPAFDHPARMRICAGKRFRRTGISFPLANLCGSTQLAQDRIHEWS